MFVLDKLQVFSAFGIVQKILIFEKNGGMQALIQYSGMEIIKDVSCLIFSSKLHISILILVSILIECANTQHNLSFVYGAL